MRHAIIRSLRIAAVLCVIGLAVPGIASAADALEITSFTFTGDNYDWFTTYGEGEVNIIESPASELPVLEYVIVEQYYDEEPPNYEEDSDTWTWLPWNDGLDFPITYPFSRDGKLTLHIWLRDADNVAYASDWLVNSQEMPEIENIQTQQRAYGMTVNWWTEDAEGYPVNAIGWLEYRKDGTQDP